MIAILMATYNGEKYIAEQINSLLRQSVQDFMLYISDDHSTDTTFDIICRYAEKYPQKIVVTQNAQNTGSAKHNFIRMMMQHKQDYVMLCDQDDVWKPDKIALTLQKMQEMVQKYGSDMPLLVHTDLEVVDENLHAVSQSFRHAMNANYERTALHQIVIQNTLTGCTAMYNRALANLIVEEPSYMVMHDWWLILIAAAFGKIGHIDDCTIYYRQHRGNLIGAKNVRLLSYRLNRLLNSEDIKRAIAETYRQANAFLHTFSHLLHEEQVSLLQQYCSIPTRGKIGRVYLTVKLGTWKNGFSRRVAQFIFI